MQVETLNVVEVGVMSRDGGSDLATPKMVTWFTGGWCGQPLPKQRLMDSRYSGYDDISTAFLLSGD
jgi:hypothetical protein